MTSDWLSFPDASNNYVSASLRQSMARSSGVSPLSSFASIAAQQSSKALAIPA